MAGTASSGCIPSATRATKPSCVADVVGCGAVGGTNSRGNSPPSSPSHSYRHVMLGPSLPTSSSAADTELKCQVDELRKQLQEKSDLVEQMSVKMKTIMSVLTPQSGLAAAAGCQEEMGTGHNWCSAATLPVLGSSPDGKLDASPIPDHVGNLDNRSWSGLLDHSGVQWSPGATAPAQAVPQLAAAQLAAQSSSSRPLISGTATPGSATVSPVMSSRVPTVPGTALSSSPVRQATPLASPAVIYRQVHLPSSGGSTTQLSSRGEPTAAFAPIASNLAGPAAAVPNHAWRSLGGQGPSVTSHYAFGAAMPQGAIIYPPLAGVATPRHQQVLNQMRR